MKKVLPLIALSLLVAMIGCSGLQLDETPQTNATAYLVGKGLGIAVWVLSPVAVEDLETAWDEMMDRNKDVDIIPPEEILKYYGDCVGILALHTNDPYGLIMDLGVLLTIFGAQFNVDGEMIEINPVPKIVLTYFAMGWDNGKAVASN